MSTVSTFVPHLGSCWPHFHSPAWATEVVFRGWIGQAGWREVEGCLWESSPSPSDVKLGGDVFSYNSGLVSVFVWRPRFASFFQWPHQRRVLFRIPSTLVETWKCFQGNPGSWQQIFNIFASDSIIPEVFRPLSVRAASAVPENTEQKCFTHRWSRWSMPRVWRLFMGVILFTPLGSNWTLPLFTPCQGTESARKTGRTCSMHAQIPP